MLRDRFVVMFSALTLVSPVTRGERPLNADAFLDKLHGMWLGQLIAIETGLPYEGHWYNEAIPPEPSAPWVLRQVWPSDDASDIEWFIELVYRTHGINPTPQQIRDEWALHVPPSTVYFGNRQAAYLMNAGFLPPQSGDYHWNSTWWAIDPQLTTESIGAISPGMRQWAVDSTGRWAHITTDGFPVHAAQFYAAMYSAAAFESDVPTLIQRGLEAIPQTSRTSQVIRDMRLWYLEDMQDGVPDWRATRHRLYDNYEWLGCHGRYWNWVESTINVGVVTMALLYGNGSYEDTVQLSVLAGWDSDCNASAAGGLIGMICGYSGLPANLTSQCGDVYRNDTRPGMPAFDSVLATSQRWRDLAEQVILANGGAITGSGSTRTYHIPDSDPVVGEPERPDPTHAAGLVAAYRARGMDVTVSSNWDWLYANWDPTDLRGLVDGITDPHYSGHRAYWTRYVDPSYQTNGDFYAIAFPTPAQVRRVVFYEGDVDLDPLDDPTTSTVLGGYFETLSVEVRRGGVWTPANVRSQSEPLDPRQAYQIIAFEIRPVICDAIRIRGTPGGPEHYTTIMELEVYGAIRETPAPLDSIPP